MQTLEPINQGRLSFVATPIGNLEDITLRALKTLRECDMVVCEDTRVTSKLLTAHQISKPLISLHEHATPEKIEQIMDSICNGKSAAYVSDAGTPNMNDPGGKLAEAAYASNIKIETIPGPSALTAAIAVCGFPMDEFTYLGFVPHKKGRAKFFAQIAATTCPVVMLESTYRISKALDELASVLDANRLIFMGREMTKLFETYYRGTVKEVKEALKNTSSKGEFTLIVGPKPKM